MSTDARRNITPVVGCASRWRPFAGAGRMLRGLKHKCEHSPSSNTRPVIPLAGADDGGDAAADPDFFGELGVGGGGDEVGDALDGGPLL